MERTRLRRLGGGCALLLAAGLGYALWVRLTGLAIPCPFRAVTGLLCPGCGVTRLCLALLRGDFPAAWSANPVLLLLLPVLAALAVRTALREEITPHCPASALRLHKHAVLYIETESASLLEKEA